MLSLWEILLTCHTIAGMPAALKICVSNILSAALTYGTNRNYILTHDDGVQGSAEKTHFGGRPETTASALGLSLRLNERHRSEMAGSSAVAARCGAEAAVAARPDVSVFTAVPPGLACFSCRYRS